MMAERVTEQDFTAVTTDSAAKRHWSAWSYGGRPLLLCGAPRGYNQADVDRLMLGSGSTVVIADLPLCKQCEKSRQRRLGGWRP